MIIQVFRRTDGQRGIFNGDEENALPLWYAVAKVNNWQRSGEGATEVEAREAAEANAAEAAGVVKELRKYKLVRIEEVDKAPAPETSFPSRRLCLCGYLIRHGYTETAAADIAEIYGDNGLLAVLDYRGREALEDVQAWEKEVDSNEKGLVE